MIANFVTTARLSCLVGALSVSSPTTLLAQNPTDDASTQARVHMGPLHWTPRIALRNLGVDTNVFNAASAPQQDATATFGPGADAWLNVWKLQASSKTAVEWIYFNKAQEQRSLNVTEDGQIEARFAHVLPRFGVGYLHTRQRPNLDVDERVEQRRTTMQGGVAGIVGHNLILDLDLRRLRYEFGRGAFGNEAIAEALNREATVTTGSVRYTLTPLTTVVLKGVRQRDRFAVAHDRDNRSISVMPGVEMKPSALISGRALVGYKRFSPDSDALPGFSGAVASVDVNYILRDAARFNLKVDRDLDYAIEAAAPYFVLTAAQATVTQNLGGRWDAVARGGRSLVAYQGVRMGGAATGDDASRDDRVLTYGVGLGRRLGDSVRVGVDVDHTRRQSVAPGRSYEGFRAGGTFTYGY